MDVRTDLVEYTIADRIAVVRLNRPDKLNAINREMQLGLFAILEDIQTNDDVWVAIITGTGRAFSTGDDLTELGGATTHPGRTTQDIYALLRKVYKPVIAAINGLCLAQGCGLALSSDIRVAADVASIGWPQVKRGVSSVSGPTMFARMVPLNKAYELLFTGEMLSAQDALALGVLNEVVPMEQLLPAAHAKARKIVAGAPLAVRAMKEVTLRTASMAPEEAYAFAELTFRRLERTEDAKEGLAAFKEKRKPTWVGR